ncbi:MAG TPA: SMP-30/gluconolactonase/LRE family protein, partial [Armatimonadota bacterium]|nr:SMP-30/gluconolactonase/LRE family protein [Armatimonadota bacterium]
EREPGTLALTEDNRILAACVDKVYVLTDDGQMLPMHQPARLLAKQFNDGKVGPDGKFYVGTIYGDEAGGLYCLDNAGRLSLLYTGLSMSNGMDWSMDERSMFLADTERRHILRFDFDPQCGLLQNRRVMTEIPAGLGGPDGLCVDAEDKIWCALCGSGHVGRIDPISGKIMCAVKLPVADVTSCTFVGDDLSLLAVTTADFGGKNCDTADQAGFTFLLEVGVRGRQPYRFKC